MRFDFSNVVIPTKANGVILKAVYKLEADNTYDVRKNEYNRKEYIALRTTGGNGIISIEGYEPILLKADTLLIVEHRNIRRYYCSERSWNFWWFEFQFEEELMLPLNNLMSISDVEDEYKHCNACLELLRVNNSSYNALASSYISLLLYKWNFAFQCENIQIHKNYELINKAVDYMNSNISENIDMLDIAKYIGLSDRRLRQIFTSFTGKSPKQYYTDLKLKMAEQLLMNTSLSIVDISDRLGFSSSFHFSKVFSKYNGMPPSRFRLKK